MVHSMVLPLIIQIDNVLVITNERTSANGGGRSEGLRPGAAGYFRGGAPKRNRQPKKAAESFV